MKTLGKVLVGSGITAALAAGGYLLWRRRQLQKRERDEWLHS